MHALQAYCGELSGSYTGGEDNQDGSAISSPVCGKQNSLLQAVWTLDVVSGLDKCLLKIVVDWIFCFNFSTGQNFN